MCNKSKALSVARKYGAEIEASKTGGITDVNIWSKEGETWLESGGSVLCESSMAGFPLAEMWQDLIERMKLGYE